ncbi:alpha-D-ribose 1-methylphosphonate 5-triphosphate diphosphatase [Roseivivax isoporae]|uniref:Phosphonate metabolism protein PhnM n=1 Tax=Roseivivax isoporae LMG 25204 TaxID=1449351 RepID=X7F6N7_9RHOB|nr:alpha-D-ribose 1-methylphosphonate 5-triphosphate diphosphatase [Roseivivax isoporae]ETX27744.1 phosphonate metabolism protein PhnM [Roseivivax isoporae LMG 25204]
MTETILSNARIVLDDEVIHGSLRLEDGRIAEIGGTSSVAGAIDCDGDHLIPGLIELHTDNLERHIEPRPKVDWPHATAILAHDGELASAGITTVFDAMRVGSVVSGDRTDYRRYARPVSRELLDLRDRGALRISHFLHLRAEICSETLLEELDEFGPEDRVGILSLMDHTPGQRQFRDEDQLRAYVMGKKGLGEEEFQVHLATLRGLQARFGQAHEAGAVAAAGRLGAVLASHDDTTAEQVAVSAGYGVQLAEFPTTEEAAHACHENGIRVMMGAPNLIRGGSHSGNVAAEALAKADRLDILSSDYIPSSLMLGAFRLGALWGDLPRGIRTVTAAPAAAAGLTDRGTIAAGARADVVRVGRLDDTPMVRGVWAQGRQVG